MRIDAEFTPDELLHIYLYIGDLVYETDTSPDSIKAKNKLRRAVKASLIAGLERAVDRTATEPSNIDPEVYKEAFKVVDHLNDIQPEDNE